MDAVEKRKIMVNALVKVVFSIPILGVLIFLPAGTLRWFNGWLFLGGFLVPVIFLLTYFLIKDPELMKRRMQYREKQAGQKKFVYITLPYFLIVFTLPGLDYRFGWSHAPFWVGFAGLGLFLLGYLLFFFVLRHNSYASRIVEVQAGQKVISDGPYAVVRHPMYTSMLLIYAAVPLTMGSFFTLIPLLALPFVLIWRIHDEEALLKRELPGYEEYTHKVKYRVIPFLW